MVPTYRFGDMGICNLSTFSRAGRDPTLLPRPPHPLREIRNCI